MAASKLISEITHIPVTFKVLYKKKLPVRREIPQRLVNANDLRGRCRITSRGKQSYLLFANFIHAPTIYITSLYNYKC